jgi:glycosyltransferase involved in cell wall biosynthesis
MKKLFIVLNSEKFLLSHRLEIALKAKNSGYDVYIISPDTGYVEKVKQCGFKFIEVQFSRSGLNIFEELSNIYKLYKLYKKEKPDVIHHVTLKICLLGSIAAKLSGTKNVINAISGFGYAFSENSSFFLRYFISFLMNFFLKSSHFKFIVQNPDDQSEIKKLNIASQDRIYLIKGSGVDLNIFKYSHPTEKDFCFLFSSRMLYEKGIMDFIEAAKLLRERLLNKAHFVLIGNCDDANRSVVSRQKINILMEPGYIDYLGYRNDVIDVLNKSNVVVLPSYYREGLPKNLIEACAVGRPIITTDLPGCRECLQNDNGCFVKERNPVDLAEKMIYLFENKDICLKMGHRSRILAEKEFNINMVVKNHFNIYNSFNCQDNILK